LFANGIIIIIIIVVIIIVQAQIIKLVRQTAIIFLLVFVVVLAVPRIVVGHFDNSITNKKREERGFCVCCCCCLLVDGAGFWLLVPVRSFHHQRVSGRKKRDGRRMRPSLRLFEAVTGNRNAVGKMGLGGCGDGEIFSLEQTAHKEAVPTTEGDRRWRAAARHRTRGRWVFFVGAVLGMSSPCHRVLARNPSKDFIGMGNEAHECVLWLIKP
jgi:hypothetical protein